MLHVITSLSDPLCSVIQDDPVRPELPIEFRVSAHSNIFVLLDSTSTPQAAVCVAYCDQVPTSVEALVNDPHLTQSVAVFYTVWSYRAGAGRSMILATQEWIQHNRPCVEQYVTLSPPTEMARKFHIRNGAQVLRTNEHTVNYIYQGSL